MMTLKELIDDVVFSTLSTDVQVNLLELLKKLNAIRQAYGKPMFVSSGLRSLAHHLDIYKEKAKNHQAPFEDGIFDQSKVPMKSKHLFGVAVDIADPKGELQKWCKANETLLKQIGIWMEDFAYTPGWVHFQSVPYGSFKPGKSLWFIPF